MTREDSVRRHRVAILQRAALLGNVTQACQEAGISRTLFYRAATPHAADPLAAASDPGSGTPGLGVRVAVADARAGAHRRSTATTAVGWLAHQCLGGLCDPQAAWPADPVGAAHTLGGPRGNRWPADRTHPSTAPAAARGGAAPGRSGVSRRVLHWQAQGHRQGVAADGVRCGLLLRDRHAGAAGHPAGDDRVPAPACDAGVRTSRPSVPGGVDRRGPRVAGAVCRGLSGARHQPSADATAVRPPARNAAKHRSLRRPKPAQERRGCGTTFTWLATLAAKE
jgi:hypothetical protein